MENFFNQFSNNCLLHYLMIMFPFFSLAGKLGNILNILAQGVSVVAKSTNSYDSVKLNQLTHGSLPNDNA